MAQNALSLDSLLASWPSLLFTSPLPVVLQFRRPSSAAIIDSTICFLSADKTGRRHVSSFNGFNWQQAIRGNGQLPQGSGRPSVCLTLCELEWCNAHLSIIRRRAAAASGLPADHRCSTCIHDVCHVGADSAAGTARDVSRVERPGHWGYSWNGRLSTETVRRQFSSLCNVISPPAWYTIRCDSDEAARSFGYAACQTR